MTWLKIHFGTIINIKIKFTLLPIWIRAVEGVWSDPYSKVFLIKWLKAKTNFGTACNTFTILTSSSISFFLSLSFFFFLTFFFFSFFLSIFFSWQDGAESPGTLAAPLMGWRTRERVIAGWRTDERIGWWAGGLMAWADGLAGLRSDIRIGSRIWQSRRWAYRASG